MKPLFIKKNGTVSKVSGIIMNLIPSYTLAEYNALTHKPLLWVRTDEEYAQIPSTDVSYGSGSVKDALDDKVSKSGDIMTGNFTVDRKNGTASAEGQSYLTVGNATPVGTNQNSTGLINLYSESAYQVTLYANPLTQIRYIGFPNKSGTVLLDTDIKIVKAQSGSSNNAVITVPSGYPYATFEIVTPVMFYVGSCDSTGTVSAVKGVDGTTPTVSGNNVTVYAGSYYRTAVLRLYTSAAF